MFDLHTHTTYSDGNCTPEELLERAASAGLSHLAITDHDNHDALLDLERKYSLNAAREIGGVRIISGVEFSTRWENVDIHVLGLNYQLDSTPLAALLKQQTAARAERNRLIYEKLASAGIELQERGTGVQQLARIGRLHIAEEIVSLGKAKNAQQAFKRYLGKSGRAYAAANWQPLSKVLEAIASSHGSSVLAHPLKYQLTRSKMKRLI
ncbi:MAG: PHP domain-containing protein, partial [Gammaproteobacteria bacterium]